MKTQEQAINELAGSIENAEQGKAAAASATFTDQALSVAKDTTLLLGAVAAIGMAIYTVSSNWNSNSGAAAATE